MTELWLTSEDSGTYGRDIGKSLPELCWEVLSVLKPHNILKIGMTNPPYILEHMEEIAAILTHPQVYSHMHIPVQSGSNKVLDSMVREYVIEDFEILCDYLCENVKGITLATDIICGFPGESDEDFQYTLDLVKKYKFPSLFISQFYPRPGTIAANMKKLDTKIVKKRSTEITKLFESYRTYDSYLGTIQKIWISDIEANKKNIDDKNNSEFAMIGHTKNYVKVIIKNVDENLMGKIVLCKITEVLKWHCVGEIIDKNPKLDEIQPVSNYKKEFQKTKVNFLAKERCAKLKEELRKKKIEAKPIPKILSEAPLPKNLPEPNKNNWMTVIIGIGVLLVFIGILLQFLGK